MPADRTLLRHVGHCGPRKNVEGRIWALPILNGVSRKVAFVQVDGQFSARQQQLIEADSLRSNITHVKHVPECDLPSYYQRADVFVFPSLYEGLGLPVAEAMACGVPAVFGRSGSLPKIAGDAAHLVEDTSPDAIVRRVLDVFENPALRMRHVDVGQARASMFTRSRTAQQLVAIYEQISVRI